MKNLLHLIILCPILMFGQLQTGFDIDGEAAGDFSGTEDSVSLSSDGTIVAIGSYGNDGNGIDSGQVRVYKNVNNVWIQIGSDINGEAAGDNSGYVDLSSDGSILAIGAGGNDGNGINSGHVRIYENINNTWTQIGSDIDGEAAGDHLNSVVLSSDGSIIAVGATGNDGSNGVNSGHVRIYENISNVWTQIGSDIDGEAAGDLSSAGLSLSSNGSIVAIGATVNNGNAIASGHVRVYENISGVWTQIGSDLDGDSSADNFGNSISLSSDGSVIAIGVVEQGNTLLSIGHVRIYKNISNVWTQVGSNIVGDNPYDYFGSSVSLSSDGSIVAIGATGNDNNNSYIGYVRLYENLNNIWTQVGSDIDGEATSDFSGSAVSLSSDGSIVAIGAIFNDGNGINSGHVRIYDFNPGTLSNNSFKLDSFSMYPNPARERVHVILSSGQELKQVNVYDSLGRFLYSEQGLEINTSHLTGGMYMIEVLTNYGKSAKKVIIQ